MNGVYGTPNSKCFEINIDIHWIIIIIIIIIIIKFEQRDLLSLVF